MGQEMDAALYVHDERAEIFAKDSAVGDGICPHSTRPFTFCLKKPSEARWRQVGVALTG